MDNMAVADNIKSWSGKSRNKLIGIVALIVLLAILIKVSGITESFSLPELRAMVKSFGIWGPFGFIILYGLAIAIGTPGTLFTIAGGLLFGRWFGTFYNVLGATLGASGAFWIARLISKKTIMERFGHMKWFSAFNKGMEKNGFNYMLFVRLVPLFPFNGINFASGITHISFRDYVLGTAIGIIPGAFVFTNAAVELGDSAMKGFKLSPGMMLAFALLGVFALVPIIYRRFKGKDIPSVEE